MKYGGEKRVRHLRRRHVRRLGGELEVKPALVERRALAMIERVSTASEQARRSACGKHFPNPSRAESNEPFPLWIGLWG